MKEIKETVNLIHKPFCELPAQYPDPRWRRVKVWSPSVVTCPECHVSTTIQVSMKSFLRVWYVEVQL